MTKVIKKFFSNFQDITEYYNFLVSKTKNHEYVEITNEWLIDNYYLLVEHKNNLLAGKKDIERSKQIIRNNYFFIKNAAIKRNYNISLKFLMEELRKHQKEANTPYTYRELSNIYPILVMVYTERLNELCRDEYRKLVDREDVEFIINSKEKLTLDSFIPDNFDIANNGHYIFEINNQLRKKINSTNNEVFKKLNEFLEENHVSLKEIINIEFQKKIENNILISNIFKNLKEFFEYSIEDIYEKVSKTEKKLLSDSIYKKMTIESKKAYRNQLLSLAHKNHANEYTYLEKIFDPDKHTGEILFKPKKNTLRVMIYLFALTAITSLIAFFIADYFIKPKILSFIILFIPISQLITQIINEYLIHRTQTKVMPKMDYSKGIPKESKTMVVIPTIIATKEKIKEMFDVLETFYLINKSENLYFTLLGDVKASNVKVEDYDKELSEYGKNYAENLNKKYKKDLYRHRRVRW